VCLSCAGRDCSIDVAERGANGGKAKLLSHYSPVENPMGGAEGGSLGVRGCQEQIFSTQQKIPLKSGIYCLLIGGILR